MSWTHGLQMLQCDHAAPVGGPAAADVVMSQCGVTVLARTAAIARSKARATGWETSTPNGDRCAQHRVTRPRVTAYVRPRS